MKRVLLISLVAVFLSACGSDGLDDLREFVQTAHADRKPKVEPVPEIKPYETFEYNATDLTDPFAVANLKPLSTPMAAGPRPDMNRRKEPLEDYPLDALKMVGTLARSTQRWAIIQAPDGTVHRAQIGSFMGQNFGKVTKIAEEKIELVELIPGSVGDWIERDASIAIAE